MAYAVERIGSATYFNKADELYKRTKLFWISFGSFDSADSGIRIGIRGQQRALGFGKYLSRFLKKLHAIHSWRALVCEQEGYAGAAKP